MYEGRSLKYVESRLDRMRHIMRLTSAAYERSASAELEKSMRCQLEHVDNIKQEIERRKCK